MFIISSPAALLLLLPLLQLHLSRCRNATGGSVLNGSVWLYRHGYHGGDMGRQTQRECSSKLEKLASLFFIHTHTHTTHTRTSGSCGQIQPPSATTFPVLAFSAIDQTQPDGKPSERKLGSNLLARATRRNRPDDVTQTSVIVSEQGKYFPCTPKLAIASIIVVNA